MRQPDQTQYFERWFLGHSVIIPKLTVTNYPEMLRKLSVAAFFVTLACVMLARAKIPSVDTALRSLDIATTEISVLGSLKLPLGTIIIPVVFAIVSESVRLHDKISDLLGIRREFDVRWILMPMAIQSGPPLNAGQFEKLKLDRIRLMSETFYAYASSTTGRQVVDSHSITQALTAWSWYWLCVESIVIILVTALVFSLSSEYFWVSVLLGISLFLILIMRVFKADSGKYAEAQVREILRDNARRAEVSAIFDAL